MKARIRSPRLKRSGGIAVALATSMLAVGQIAIAAGPPPIDLGTATPFAVLAGTPAVTSIGATTITGDLGISPAAAVTGFPPGTVSGTIHAADAVALQAKVDLTDAYTVAEALPVTATHGSLGGLTLVGGVYNAGGVTLDLTGTLTLDGENDPSSVWVFQASSDLITASSSTVALINGASACNVFWQVDSSATLGSGSTFVGTIMALTSITMQGSVTVTGRALARNGQVTLINDSIDTSACAPATAPTPGAPTPGAPTPIPSVTDVAISGSDRGNPLGMVVFAVILTAMLAALATATVRPARQRR